MLRWKLKRIFEIFVLMQNDSRKKTLQDRGCIKETGVVGREWGTEREGGEDVRCEDVTQTFLHANALTQKGFYTQTPLHTQTSLHKVFHRRVFYTYAFFTLRIHFRTNILENRDRDAFTHTHRWAYARKPLQTVRLFTQVLLHTDAFTHRLLYSHTHTHFYTQTTLHIDSTHRRFYTQTLLHTNLYTQTPLLADAFTHRCFYTQALLHTNLYTQTPLLTDAFTHRHCYRRFYTQTLWHTDAFIHRRFYTQTLLHTNDFTHRPAFAHADACTHRSFEKQTPLHTQVVLVTPPERNLFVQILLQICSEHVHHLILIPPPGLNLLGHTRYSPHLENIFGRNLFV